MTDTVTLHPDDRRLLQEVAALLRGLQASLPRPVPPGDWGRHGGSPGPSVRGPAAAPAAVQSGMIRMERPARNRKHTAESKAADRERLDAWMDEFRMTLHTFAKTCGVNSGQLHLVWSMQDGMSALMEKRIVEAVERLRARKAAR